VKRGVVLLLALAAPSLVAAQQPVADRLVGRVPPDLNARVSALADSAARRGLPVEPLVQKAIEGSAKAAAPDRILAAVQAVYGRLGRAQAALIAAGELTPSVDAVDAGAFALAAGLSAGDVESVARACGSRYPAPATLRVAGTLAAIGVPAAAAVDLVRQTLRSGADESAVLALPGRVEAQVGSGVTPGQAAAQLGRAAAAHAAAPGQTRVPQRGKQAPSHP
jgi:hypothetical protein